MKNIVITFSVFLFLLIISCSNKKSEKYIGKWAHPDGIDKLVITKDGDVFLARASGNYYVEFGSYTFRLDNNGSLKGDKDGDINYIESSGKLIWKGVEWSKITDTAEKK